MRNKVISHRKRSSFTTCSDLLFMTLEFFKNFRSTCRNVYHPATEIAPSQWLQKNTEAKRPPKNRVCHKLHATQYHNSTVSLVTNIHPKILNMNNPHFKCTTIHHFEVSLLPHLLISLQPSPPKKPKNLTSSMAHSIAVGAGNS